MSKLRTERTEMTYGSDNIFSDLGFDPEEAASLLVRTQLMLRLQEYIQDEGLTPEKAAKYFGVTRSRISLLMRDKIDEFSIDALVGMLARAGLQLQIEFQRAA